ncbi:FadR/GntR family transcriptional regulator [Brucella intermedia]|uniref:FadR/GntR family transcriptional regulator n=1 Tax=Brucella intermedia TaxID=94625 RepID=UPI00224A56BE|nr:FadR/GntR family transcriptional regulator [Brucella intermedia]
MFDTIPKRATLVETVVSKLISQINSGEPPAGGRLPSEAAIAEQLGVSRTVVREAVSQVRADGLIYNLPGKGLFVSKRESGEGVIRFQRRELEPTAVVAYLLEMRTSLEADSARFAAERCDRRALERIREACINIDHATQKGRDGVDEDFAFHIEIARASENPYTLQVLEFLSESLKASIKKSRDIDSGRAEYLDAVRDEHAQILKAIENKKGEAAAAAMRNHLEAGSARLTTR